MRFRERAQAGEARPRVAELQALQVHEALALGDEPEALLAERVVVETKHLEVADTSEDGIEDRRIESVATQIEATQHGQARSIREGPAQWRAVMEEEIVVEPEPREALRERRADEMMKPLLGDAFELEGELAQ